MCYLMWVCTQRDMFFPHRMGMRKKLVISRANKLRPFEVLPCCIWLWVVYTTSAHQRHSHVKDHIDWSHIPLTGRSLHWWEHRELRVLYLALLFNRRWNKTSGWHSWSRRSAWGKSQLGSKSVIAAGDRGSRPLQYMKFAFLMVLIDTVFVLC